MKIQTLTSAEAKGRRSYMEDSHFTSVRPEGILLAVFDGHGGSEASHHAWANFAHHFIAAKQANQGDIRHALRTAIFDLAQELKDYHSGTTLSAVYVGTGMSRVLTATIGDSPILIDTPLSSGLWVGPDHNVRSNPAEADAVQERGGFISGGYAMANFSGNGLQMGRALGDSALRSILSTEPEIHEVPVVEGGFILVGTDGLFDPGHSGTKASIEHVVTLVKSGADAQSLVNDALARKTGDNVTAILARF